MAIKRRYFLFGAAVVAGAGVFGIKWADGAARDSAMEATLEDGESGFSAWLKIAADDAVTIYSPTIDFGQGSHTALAQMAADELDADWSKVRVEQAPALSGFANSALLQGFANEFTGWVGDAMPQSLLSMLARAMPMQITGGSSSVRYVGQTLMRKAGAAARQVLMEEAAARLNAPASELTTADSKVTHAPSGRSLRYGELAPAAAARALPNDPPLKPSNAYRLIGQSVQRLDIPAKVDGTAQYGIDVSLPDMRVATIMMAPVRGGRLDSVDESPALAVSGVEKVVKLDDAVAVIAKGYWPALKGLQSLSPNFSDGGHGALSSAAIYEAQDQLRAADKPDNKAGDGDVDAAFDAQGATTVEALYRVPFIHHAMMEPFAMTAHHHDGKLDVWVGLQDPLSVRKLAAQAAGLDVADVTVHPLIMGGGFGRRFPEKCQIISQAVQLAMQCPWPVKLIWSREEEVRHGAYRCQSSGHLKAALGADGKIAAWRSDYVQRDNAEMETKFNYVVPATSRRHFAYTTNQDDGPWRSVNSTQQGFYNESFIDELAHAAEQDPYQFRRKHLPEGSRHREVLDEVARRANWETPAPQGIGRGIALVESFGTIVGQVVEASLREDGYPRVHKVTAVVDCGSVVNPKNAEAQIEGGIIMALSVAIGEEITLENGAVAQSNFSDYPILKLADAPPEMSVHFIQSGAKMGGIGEPGVPPAPRRARQCNFRRYRQPCAYAADQRSGQEQFASIELDVASRYRPVEAAADLISPLAGGSASSNHAVDAVRY